MILYNLKIEDNSFRITKFDDDLNPESSYLVSEIACECPQGHKPKCRHRIMLPLMKDRAGSAWFYRFDDKQWYDPTGLAALLEPNPVLDNMPYVEAGVPAPSSEPTKLRRLR